MLNYSFHTIEFKKTICTKDYSSVHYFLKRHKSKYYPLTTDERIWQSNIFDHIGIRTYIKHFDTDYPYSEIKFVVNPRLAVGDKDYIGIFEPTKENIMKFINSMNQCIKMLQLSKLTGYCDGREMEKENSIDDFTISRCDLCVNYQFASQSMADTYLKLMKRGQLFSFLNEKTTYSDTAKRQKKFANAIVLEAGSFTISIYSKKAQMLDQIGFYKEIPPEAEGLLRFEIQLGQEKVKYLRDKNGCSTFFDFMSEVSEMAYNEFKRYISGLFLKGDYFQLRDAKSLVIRRYPDQASEIVGFLEKVSDARSLDVVQNQYDTAGLRYDKILRKLKKLGINPVTLPEEDAKKLACHRLPNVPFVLGLIKCE